jgi:2-amino-4-hydroxy-6-hydroxymethyldihydropteridine diphosphokinase
VRASLADQPGPGAACPPAGLTIALGANLPSPAGPPLATLLAVRPLLEGLLKTLLGELGGPPQWSPLFRSMPVGGPAGQPDYLNAAVLVRPARQPSAAAALGLLAALQQLERQFGRRRAERWGPRSLDLDLLWWGHLRCQGGALALPHPHLLERAFVLGPLAAIDADLVPPGGDAAAAALVKRLEAADPTAAPQRLAGRPGWPE